jgi:hypothetical protein
MILEKPSRKGRLFLFWNPEYCFDASASFVTGVIQRSNSSG